MFQQVSSFNIRALCGNRFLQLFIVTIVSVTSSGICEPDNGFFSENTALKIFSKRSKPDGKEKFVILPVRSESQDGEAIERQNSKSTQVSTLRERLQREFGDPKKPFRPAAAESAPAPYKGMLAALKEGDKELAFEYAIQYVRYKRELRELNGKITSLIGQGMVREGELAENSWPSSPAYSEDIYLRDLPLENNEEPSQERSSSRTVEIDEEAQEVLERVKETQFSLFKSKDAIPKLDSRSLKLKEEDERNAVRTRLRGRLPIDPNGKIDVYFFFDPKDPVARGIAPDVERLFQAIEKEEDFTFIAFTTTNLSTGDVAEFRRLSHASFPIVAGKDLAKQLGVSKSPTTVFYAATTNVSHIEEGVRSYYFMDEIAQIMGRRK